MEHRSPRTRLLQDLAAYFDAGDFQQTLARRVAWQTESDGAQPPAALEGYLRQEIAPALAECGFSCEILPNPEPRGGPFLLAERIEGATLPTVLTYGHGDVINGQSERWSTGLDPWRLECRGPRWYGRGTADNKGQHTINLAALSHTIRARGGRLGYNVKVLLEMGEEAGSPGLHTICAQQRARLASDLLLACDGPRVSASRPTLFLGSRGAVNFRLRVESRAGAHHSGNWGGVLVNPAVLLSHALASLIGPRGRLLVPGLRPPELTAQIRTALAGLPVGGSPDDPEVDADWGEPGLEPIEKLVGWNTLEVLAMESGTPRRPVNAIPASAVAHCQLRFVVGTRWQELAPLLRAHLDASGFPMVQVEVTSSSVATRLDLEHPWVRWARQSLARSADAPVATLPNLAGSLPNDAFSEILGLPTLWVPHSYPACSQHAPDEHLLASVAREGLQLMGGLYWDLGEADAPWAASAR